MERPEASPTPITPLDHEPVRLQDDEEATLALRLDLAASRDAVVIGIDYAAIEAELLLVDFEIPRDACG